MDIIAYECEPLLCKGYQAQIALCCLVALMVLTQGRTSHSGSLNKCELIFHEHFCLCILEVLAQGKWSTGCSPLARRAPDKLRVRHFSSSSFQYSFKQNYTDDSSRGDLISARDKPIPKGVDTTIKIAFKYNNKKA